MTVLNGATLGAPNQVNLTNDIDPRIQSPQIVDMSELPQDVTSPSENKPIMHLKTQYA